MIESIAEVWNVSIELTGFSPALMLPVFVLVSLISWALKIRQKYPAWKDFILGVMCFVVGCLVASVGEWETYRELASAGLVLGSVSALSYKVIKGLLEGAKEYLEGKLMESVNIELDIEDSDVM